MLRNCKIKSSSAIENTGRNKSINNQKAKDVAEPHTPQGSGQAIPSLGRQTHLPSSILPCNNLGEKRVLCAAAGHTKEAEVELAARSEGEIRGIGRAQN